MTQETYNKIITEQIERCKAVLLTKSAEYATEDKLHNFKVAAELQGVTVAQALAGMMCKHTVSVYDMINSGEEHSLDKWNEKITDSINYLLLLRAVVEDDRFIKECEM